MLKKKTGIRNLPLETTPRKQLNIIPIPHKHLSKSKKLCIKHILNLPGDALEELGIVVIFVIADGAVVVVVCLPSFYLKMTTYGLINLVN